MCVNAFQFCFIYTSGRDKSLSHLMLQFSYTRTHTQKKELKMIFQNSSAKVFVSSLIGEGRVDTEI